jgi:hypothetical protein
MKSMEQSNNTDKHYVILTAGHRLPSLHRRRHGLKRANVCSPLYKASVYEERNKFTWSRAIILLNNKSNAVC